MERKDIIKRITAFSLITMMAVAFMPIFGLSDASAAKKKAKPKGRLVKTVKYEEMINGAWVKKSQTSYTYNKKKDPRTIKENRYYSDGSISGKKVFRYSYKYRKNGKRLSCTIKEEGDIPGTVRKCTYDKYGHLTRYEFRDEQSTQIANLKYTKTGYMKNYSEYVSDIENGSDSSEPIKCIISSKKGFPVKMDFYYQASDWEKECSITFCKKSASKKGLIASKKQTLSKEKMSFSYKMKNGRVRSVTVTIINNAGNKSKERYTFYYTKKQAGKVRYANMINNIVDYSYSGFLFRWF